MSEYSNDIVISCRIRLARNIKNLPFPLRTTDEKAAEAVAQVENSIKSHERVFNKIEASELTPMEKSMLVEKHLTSSEWGSNLRATVFISENEEVSIMVNEEDHIRIQCILEGFQLNKAYSIADSIDDFLEHRIKCSYDEQYGYLTSCPTNVGTGMRASIMLHLPSLTMSNQINSLSQTLARFGITIRGLYGEGSESLGDLYQISNQVTLGIDEQSIISNIHSVGKEIIKRERDLRHELLKDNKIYLEDKVYRAWGILKNARNITLEESMNLISMMRLGVDLEIIVEDTKKINHLMTNIQPGILSDIYHIKEQENRDIDKLRAHHIRKVLGESIN